LVVRELSCAAIACAFSDVPAAFEVRRALQRNEGREGYLMAASNQILLVVDAGTPVAAFTARQELKAYVIIRRRLDAFINPLVYTFWGNQGPSIMTISSALE
jgi:hypothetical protein